MRLLIPGLLSIVAAISGFVILPEHKPLPPCTADCVPSLGASLSGGFSDPVSRLSQPLYDALRITTWTLLLLGVTLLILGVIRVARGS